MAAMRATPKKFVKTLFVTSLMCFVVVNLNLFLRAGVGPEDPDPDPMVPHAVPSLPLMANLSVVRNVSQAPTVLAPSSSPGGGLLRSNLSFAPLQVGESRLLLPPLGNRSAMELRALVREANRKQRILNLEQFALGEGAVVVVVQVHNRKDYLHPLIASLRRARDIQNALLIFSHDFLSDEINEIVAAIDFCPVMQIFYPFAIQFHPHEFPGESPDDCPRDIKKDEAMKRNCVNAKYPDKYGHYREAKYCQTKHHWFWKLSHVFDHLDVTSSFTGPVLFIEEDHYVVEDFIHVLQRMYRLREKACADCSIFTIGTYDKKPTYGPMASRSGGISSFFASLFGLSSSSAQSNVLYVDITNWVSSKHNMGMSFNREVWNKIKACAEAFCAFDDYNWDWSLHNIGMSCIPNKLKVMVSKSPRIYHIGECGVHHKGKNCDPAQRVTQIQQLLAQNRQWLYPENLAVGGYPRPPARMPKPNGGWGDLRDHQLCMSFLLPESHH